MVHFLMGKPLIVYRNAPAFKEWPTNFKLLLQALLMVTNLRHLWVSTKYEILTRENFVISQKFSHPKNH